MRLALLALLILLPIPAAALDEGCGFSFCTKHWMGSGICDGTDQLPILEPPWEPRPISIVGVTIAVRTTGSYEKHLHRWWRSSTPQSFYAYAGNSFVPDVMLFRISEGSETVMYPPPLAFKLPAATEEMRTTRLPHIDLHVSCSGWGLYQAWLVLYYRVD